MEWLAIYMRNREFVHAEWKRNHFDLPDRELFLRHQPKFDYAWPPSPFSGAEIMEYVEVFVPSEKSYCRCNKIVYESMNWESIPMLNGKNRSRTAAPEAKQ